VRVETVGLTLCLLSAFAIAFLISGRELPGIESVTPVLGLHTLTLALALLGLGALIWRRQTGWLISQARFVLAGALLVLFSAGLLSLARPNLELGTTSFADVTAGGDLGRLLFDDAVGVLAWLICLAAFGTVVWPHAVNSTVRRTPDALATVWSWRIPYKIMTGIAVVVDFVFPTKPPPDERPVSMAPSWLPQDLMADEGRGPSPISVAAPEPDEDDDEDDDDGPLSQAPLPMRWAPGDEDAPAPLAPSSASWLLPPMDLLVGAPPSDESARPDNAVRAGLIVDTLASFGVDARVSAYHEGPVVTQFDVEPGWEVKLRSVQERDKDGKLVFDKDGKPKLRTEEVSRTRVRVNQITTLTNDLALALAAPSLRIEAPVPGRSVVGIEVPNTAASVVTLRSVIETPAFQRLGAKTKLALPLGKSVAGEPVVADLTKMPHLLIAGATGSGKSVCMNSIVASILMQCRPEEVRFVMVDPKRVELSGFALIPHLAFSSIVVDVEKVVGTLGAVLHEMESRYKRFAALAVRNIEAYNKHPKVTERLPFWVVIIDELADLMMAAPFEVERQICRLAQLARATGIHLIVATQRPSVDVITGLIKANFPTRIAFAMSSQVDSRTILDMAGAERLLGRGDMLYMATDASKPKRVQGVYVSDQEIDRLVSFWAQQRATNSTPVFDHLLEEAQAAMEEEEDADPMYERAKALAEQHTRMSTSMLQRRLRIGYPRAARLMDRLEEEGVVGGGGMTSHEVLADDDTDDDEAPLRRF
jgi:S-DNA-T family DNA segregation ATPase FtsK/SpoIIIE